MVPTPHNTDHPGPRSTKHPFTAEGTGQALLCTSPVPIAAQVTEEGGLTPQRWQQQGRAPQNRPERVGPRVDPPTPEIHRGEY